MGWRIGVAFFFLAVLTYCVLLLAYRIIPAKQTLPDPSLPPTLQAPLYGQIPADWTKMPWGEEVRVFPKIPKYPQLEIDSSGNLIYPLN